MVWLIPLVAGVVVGWTCSQCLLSNIAFSSDAVRLHVGRTCANTIVAVTAVMNADPFLFPMALRAVGNLTRCDENIMRVVGNGVISGIVQGAVALHCA